MAAPELDDETKVRIALVAKDIFNRYLAKDADNFFITDALLRQKVFEKFGYTEPNPVAFGAERNSNYNAQGYTDDSVLFRNLNFDLFQDVTKPVMRELQIAYKAFQSTKDFAVMREDVNYEEKLFKIMLEGGLVARIDESELK